MRLSLVTVAVAFLVAVGRRSGGQELQGTLRVAPQSVVRVWATSPLLNDQRGIVLNMSADTLYLLVGERREGVPVNALAGLRVQTRARGGHGWSGFFAGAFLGGIVGYTSFRPSAAICENACDMRPLNAAFAGLVGGVIGAVVGSHFPTEKWERLR